MLAPLAASKWLSCPRPDSLAPLRLWCFPFAGGGAAAWHPWSTKLAGTAEVVAFRLPGRESRLGEPPLRECTQLIAALADHIAPHTNEPYAFCGHSLGALLAFEVARVRRERNLPGPAGLIASGARAPDTPRREPNLHALPDDEFVTQVDRRYGGIPPALLAQREFLELFLPALRADLTVFETYSHAVAAPLALPLLALGGESDPRVSRGDLLAWETHVTGPFSAEFFPGGHFFLQPEIEKVIPRVRHFLSSLRIAPATH